MPTVLSPDRQTLTSKDVFDFEEFSARCMGNLVFAERVLSRFQQRLDEDLVELKQAATATDLDVVAQISHRIKGSAANVAARAIIKVAGEIETAARQDDADTVWSRLPILDVERDRFHRAVPSLNDEAAEAP